MPLNRVPIPSPNYSSRAGATVTTIVLHTAEGATTYQSLGAFFANPASGVSSHVGIDDTPNTVGEYVQAVPGKAWTAANANPWSVQAELCAFAAWTPDQWNAHPQMLANTAAWIAEEAARFGIPIVALSPADAQNPAVRGVCQHADLGSMGGGHWDCGPGFPMATVLDMATGTAPAPEPPPPALPAWPFMSGAQEDTPMAICTHPSGKRIDLVWVDPNHNVWHAWTDDTGDMRQMKKENLGGTAITASCCWLDANRFQVTVANNNQELFWKTYDGKGTWSAWIQVPGVTLAG